MDLNQAQQDRVSEHAEQPRAYLLDKSTLVKLSLYQLQMLEDPWAALTKKNHQYDKNANSLKHRAIADQQILDELLPYGSTHYLPERKDRQQRNKPYQKNNRH